MLKFAVIQMPFKCNDLWYTQKDGLAMGENLVVKMTNLWKTEFEPVLRKKIAKICKPMKDLNGI